MYCTVTSFNLTPYKHKYQFPANETKKPRENENTPSTEKPVNYLVNSLDRTQHFFNIQFECCSNISHIYIRVVASPHLTPGNTTTAVK